MHEIRAGCKFYPLGRNAGRSLPAPLEAHTEGSPGRPCRSDLGRYAPEMGARSPWEWQGGILNPA